MNALTYGGGVGYWTMNFYEADGETPVSFDEVRPLLREPVTDEARARMADIIVRWNIEPGAEVPKPIEKKVARVVAPEPEES